MSFEYTETYRSGHNGADSKSVREQSPASSNLAVSAIKKQVHFCAPVFYIMRDTKRAMRSIETVRGTVSVPGCVPPNAEVRRANLAVSAIKKQVHFCAPVFYIMRDTKRAMRSISADFQSASWYSPAIRTVQTASLTGGYDFLILKINFVF